MIVKTLKSLEGTDRDVSAEGWQSRRLLLKDEGMGFSMHDTLIAPHAELPMHYQNHLEAVYIIEGRGEILDKATGQVHALEPFTIYALDQHDQHVLRAFDEGLRCVCVFNPPVSGREVHDASGAYPLVD